MTSFKIVISTHSHTVLVLCPEICQNRHQRSTEATLQNLAVVKTLSTAPSAIFYVLFISLHFQTGKLKTTFFIIIIAHKNQIQYCSRVYFCRDDLKPYCGISAHLTAHFQQSQFRTEIPCYFMFEKLFISL